MGAHSCRIARFSKNYKYIIDSDNKHVNLDDPRVVHIWPISTSPVTTRMISEIYKKRGWNFRYAEEISRKGLQYAKKLCSGRECLSCMSVAGETVRDLEENRQENEISVYYNLDMPGPCQSGGLAAMWDVFARQLNQKNTVFLANTNLDNNYFGQGETLATELVIAAILGDVVQEAEYSLTCLAKDSKAALEACNAETEKLIKSLKNGFMGVFIALTNWSRSMKKIPLKAKLEDTPKVLIFGRLGVLSFYHEIADYFLSQGILPKIEEFSNFVSFLEARPIVRFGLLRGLVDPVDQFKVIPLLGTFLNPEHNFKTSFKIIRARAHLAGVDIMVKLLRRIAARSGLLFYRPIPYMQIIKEGNKFASYNSDSETPMIAGLYSLLSQKRDLHGFVHASYFTCLPSMNAQALNKKSAGRNALPFAAIDCDGLSLSANQLKILETLSVQVRRVHT